MKVLYSHYLADEGHPAVRMVDAIAEGLRSLGHDVQVHRSLGEIGSPSASVPAKAHRLSAVRGKLWFAKAISRNTGMETRDAISLLAF